MRTGEICNNQLKIIEISIRRGKIAYRKYSRCDMGGSRS